MFPIHYLPDDCAALVENVASSMPAPIDFAACALLGTASAALVGRVSVEIQPGYTQPVQLWMSMTGDSGAKKTPTLNKFVGPLRKWLMEERTKEAPCPG